MVLHEVERAAPHHGGLIDHQHVAVGEAAAGGVGQVHAQPGHGDRRDAGAGFELGGGTRGDGHPDHLVAGRFPADPGDAEHGRLARSGLADDHVQAVARREEHFHPPPLLEVEVGMGLEGPGQHLGGNLARAITNPGLRRVADAALDAKHLHRRVAAVTDAGSDERPRLGAHLVEFGPRAGEDPHHARAGEQLVGEGDDFGGGGVDGRATAARASRRLKVEANSVSGVARGLDASSKS